MRTTSTSADAALKEYAIELVKQPAQGAYDAVVIAVAHSEFVAMGSEKIKQLCKPKSVLYDLKYVLNKTESDLRL